MRPTNEDIEILRSVACLTALDSDDFRALESSIEINKHQTGSQVFQQDDPADAFYVVLVGRSDQVIFFQNHSRNIS